MIGSLIMMGFQGQNPEDSGVQSIAKLIRQDKIGGVILFTHNIASPEQLKRLTHYLKSIKPDLLIAVDQEGGKVRRLRKDNGFDFYPSAKKVAEEFSDEQAFSLYKKMAKDLKDNGINFNLAPVVDLDHEDSPSPVIGGIQRAFSDDPEEVTQKASLFIKAHREEGILTALKHFPGHGYAQGDTHQGLTDITYTWEEKELLPFQKLVEQEDVTSIMTAHLKHQSWDKDHPVTLSPKILKQMLRDKLNFDGVILSDDLQMGAILDHYSLDKTVGLALNAGCDILVFSNNPAAAQGEKNWQFDEELVDKVHNIVSNALEEKKLALSQIEQSVKRIQVLKTTLQ